MAAGHVSENTLNIFFFVFSQGMVRIYDIPDNTFESSDEDEDEEEEEEEDEKGELFRLHRELLSLYLC